MLGNVRAEKIKNEISLQCSSNSFIEPSDFRSKIRSQFSFRTNCRSQIREVGNNRHHELSWLFVENSLPSKFRYFFVEKPRKAANFGEIRLHYFCTILYESLPGDGKEKVKSILFIMDKFFMSLEGYRELSQVEQTLPRAYVVQNCAKLLDNQWTVKRWSTGCRAAF